MNVQQLLIQAIRGRRLLVVSTGPDQLIVEPHAYGHDPRGNAVLLCYQITRGQVQGIDPGWRMVRLNDTVEISEADGHFSGARPGYHRGNGDLSSTYACL